MKVLESLASPVEKQTLLAWAREVDWSGWTDQVVPPCLLRRALPHCRTMRAHGLGKWADQRL